MSEENVNAARKAYEDFNSGNIPGVVGIIADEVEWIEHGGGKAPSGTFTSPDAVQNEVFAPIPENFDEFVCTPENFEDEGDKVTVTGRFTGKSKSGAELDATFTHNWEFKDGKVTRLENGVDKEAWAAAWS